MKEETINKIKEAISLILRSLSIAGEVVVKKSDRSVVANILTGRPELLIGRGGQTLLAIQQVVRAMVSRDLEDEEILVVDVENYRQRHNDRVMQQGREAALKVLAGENEVHLAPMTSYERRLIHMAVADFADVEAESEGEGLERHIVVKKSK